MKIFSSVYIIIFSVLFSFSQVVTARYETGDKKIVCDIDGEGINERIIKRYHFSKQGILILTEDFIFMDTNKSEDDKKNLNKNIWEIQIFDYNDIYLDITESNFETHEIFAFKNNRKTFPQKFYIDDSVFYSIDLNEKCISDTILDFSNNQINLMDSINSIVFSYKFLSQENILLSYNDTETYYGISNNQNSDDIDNCLYNNRMDQFKAVISGKWYSYDGISELDFNEYNVEYLDSGYVLLMGDSVKVSYFDGENPSIYFSKDENEYTFYRKTFNEVDYEDSTITKEEVVIKGENQLQKIKEEQKQNKKSSWIQGAISVLIIIFVIAQTIGG